jgi:hypothetical protein
MTTIIGANKLRWLKRGDGWTLHQGTSTRVLANVVRDGTYAAMWRVKLPNGHLSDMANLTWTKDAAKGLVLTALNNRGYSSIKGGKKAAADAPPCDSSDAPLVPCPEQSSAPQTPWRTRARKPRLARVASNP